MTTDTSPPGYDTLVLRARHHAEQQYRVLRLVTGEGLVPDPRTLEEAARLGQVAITYTDAAVVVLAAAGWGHDAAVCQVQIDVAFDVEEDRS